MRQCFVGEIAIGEKRVAAVFGDDLGIQRNGLRHFLEMAEIGMPFPTEYELLRGTFVELVDRRVTFQRFQVWVG